MPACPLQTAEVTTAKSPGVGLFQVEATSLRPPAPVSTRAFLAWSRSARTAPFPRLGCGDPSPDGLSGLSSELVFILLFTRAFLSSLQNPPLSHTSPIAIDQGDKMSDKLHDLIFFPLLDLID